jgi:7-cyano-7-deazaguanine synthase
MKPAAVCIMSGGLDSVCYAAMLSTNYDLYLLTFSYGQRAKKEIARARQLSKILKAKDHKVVDIGFMKSLYGRSNALTDSRQTLTDDFSQNLVVPIRNAVFITIAAAWAMSINARVVAYGAHTGDVLHYSDCRPEFARMIAQSLNMAEADGIASGVRPEITVMSPAVAGLDKSALLKMGHKILGDRVFQTWSCYSNEAAHCGQCESCINRKNAFTSAGIEDKTRYAKNGSPKSSEAE